MPSLHRLGPALLCIAAITGCLAMAPAPAQAARSFTVFAHRGYPAQAVTENTIAALNRASNAGVRATEVDVRPTADGRFLLMHDATLNRTTTCSGKVSNRTRSWILRHCKGEARREHIPTIGQVLGWARTRGEHLLVEVKPGGWHPGDITRLSRIILDSGAASRTIVHSRGATLLEEVEAAAPRLHTQYISRNWSDASRHVNAVDGVNVYARYLTTGRVKALHHRHKYVLGRESDRSKDWRKILRVGADGLVTDRPVDAQRLERDRR